MYRKLGLRKVLSTDKSKKPQVRIARVNLDLIAEVVLRDGRFATVYRPTMHDVVESQNHEQNIQKVCMLHRCVEIDGERLSMADMAKIDYYDTRILLSYIDRAMSGK
jgi:hypothetical protein